MLMLPDPVEFLAYQRPTSQKSTYKWKRWPASGLSGNAVNGIGERDFTHRFKYIFWGQWS